MDPAAWTFVILGLAIVAFLSGRVPLAVVAIGVALSLWATGVLTLPEALSGFGDPTVLFIASLFVISEALDASGVTAWIGRWVVRRAGRGRARLTVLIGVIAAVVTAFISINGAVAALVPIVVIIALRTGLVPSKMLIPLAFIASAGSLLTLAGTPVNPVVSDAAVAAGGRAFGFFEFALAGVPLVALTILVIVLFGNRLLPERTPDRMAGDGVDPAEAARSLRESYRVSLATGALFTADEGVAEVIIPPRSPYIGRLVSPGILTRDGTLVILGVRRGDESTTSPANPTGRVEIRAGDAVLVQGPWEDLQRYTSSPGVVPVTPPQAMQRAIPLGRGAKRSLLALAGMIVLLATGIVPPAVGGLLAAGAVIVTRVLTAEQAFRAISWTTVVLIAGMVPLANAFATTGASDIVADGVLGIVGPGSPHLALLALCVVAVVLGQFISNVATVLVLIPVAVSMAQTLDVSVQPFMMALSVAGAAAFLTPIATPANLMVMQPGGYRFGDYWRLGAPMVVVFLAVAVLYVPLIWHF